MDQMSAFHEFLSHVFPACLATLGFVTSAYLLLRRANAFASEIVSPVRLRRWTAGCFAAGALSHLYWLFTLFY